VDPRAGLNTVVKRKIPNALPGLEPPTIQSVAQRYTTELSQHLDNEDFFIETGLFLCVVYKDPGKFSFCN
jgi:hypothetical protein